MRFEPKDPAFDARVRDSFARQAFMATLGATIVRLEPGRVEIALEHRSDLTRRAVSAPRAAATRPSSPG